MPTDSWRNHWRFLAPFWPPSLFYYRLFEIFVFYRNIASFYLMILYEVYKTKTNGSKHVKPWLSAILKNGGHFAKWTQRYFIRENVQNVLLASLMKVFLWKKCIFAVLWLFGTKLNWITYGLGLEEQKLKQRRGSVWGKNTDLHLETQ